MPVAVAVMALSGALALWAGWFAVRDRAVVLRQVIGAGVVEVALVVQVVVAAVLMAGGADPAGGAATYWGYLVTILLMLPLAVLWAFAERTRWSSVVLVVAAVAVLVMQLRIVQVWEGPA